MKWRVGDDDLCGREHPLLMGILNVTPDSFSDGGQFQRLDDAVRQAEEFVEAGVDIIDIGGESTRPGATPVELTEELNRTISVVEQVCRRTRVPVSIDTTKSEVARQALDSGAQIVNDISGLTFDENMLKICAKADASVCVMHILGDPQTMQQAPVYDDVVQEVCEFLQGRMTACVQAGIAVEKICLDPGIGFGKTAEHNLQLMRSISTMKAQLQRPVLIGHSRKRFLSKVLGREVNERTFGTAGVSIALAQNGADVLRVHDVRGTSDALIAWKTVCNGQNP